MSVKVQFKKDIFNRKVRKEGAKIAKLKCLKTSLRPLRLNLASFAVIVF